MARANRHDTPTLLRTTAKQQRSRLTFESVLTAAGRSFDQIGVAATTMDAIGREAGCSIGTVYRFFENRDAIVATISLRWREVINARALVQFSDESLRRDAAEVIADFLDAFRSALVEVPGARALLAAAIMSTPAVDQAFWIEHLDRFIQRYAPELPRARRRRAAQAYQTITAALMAGAARGGHDIEPALREARSVLLGYTLRLADESGSARSHHRRPEPTPRRSHQQRRAASEPGPRSAHTARRGSKSPAKRPREVRS